MIPKLVRSKEALRAARQALGFTADGLARMVRVEDGRTVRRWESGEREIPGSVTVLLEVAMGYLTEMKLISIQLQKLRSGEMHTQSNVGNRMVDDTAETIAQLNSQHKSLAEALEIITRQPPPGAASTHVHWYSLQRMTPLFDPPNKDEWSIPGELSPEAALAYFEKYEDIPGPLTICEDGDLSADYILLEREVIRSQSGASQRLSAGDLVRTHHVRRGKSV